MAVEMDYVPTTEVDPLLRKRKLLTLFWVALPVLSSATIDVHTVKIS